MKIIKTKLAHTNGIKEVYRAYLVLDERPSLGAAAQPLRTHNKKVNVLWDRDIHYINDPLINEKVHLYLLSIGNS